ncbi:MAG: thioredoxin [Candidatus Saccharimonadales bacterium]
MALHTTTTQAEFKSKVLENNKIVLVDFWAVWCAPCHAMAPVLEATAKKLDDKLDIVKVNIEESPDNAQLAGTYGVRGIPNMQVFKNGEMIKELVGVRPQHVLEGELKDLLAG